MLAEAPVFERSTEINPQRSVDLASGLVANPALRESKFDVLMEMNRFINDVNIGLREGKTVLEAVGASTKILEIHLRGHSREIIKSKVVLPHINRFAEKDGQLRIVGSNGEPIVNSITAQERNGSVLESSKAIENSLIDASDNSFAVLMSPSGWNGFIGPDGREAAPHQNSQTMIFWKDQVGDLKGLTLHTDLDVGQSKEVMQDLGVSYPDSERKGEREEIVDIVSNPALLSLPKAYANPFEYVLDKILSARGNDPFRLLQQDRSVEIRSIAEVRADIRRFDTLLGGSLEEEKHIAELTGFILKEAASVNQKNIQQEIINKIEKTILKLTRTYLQESAQALVYDSGGRLDIPDILYQRNLADDEDFSREIDFLKTRAGCPPSVAALAGTAVGGVSLNGLASRGREHRWFVCPKCGYEADGPVGNQCPKSKGGCGITMERAKAEGIVVC